MGAVALSQGLQRLERRLQMGWILSSWPMATCPGVGGKSSHYLRLGLTREGGRIIPVSFGHLWQLRVFYLPVWIAHPAVVAFLQGSTLTIGIGSSIWLAAKNRSTTLCRLWWSTTWCTVLFGFSLCGV